MTNTGRPKPIEFLKERIGIYIMTVIADIIDRWTKEKYTYANSVTQNA